MNTRALLCVCLFFAATFAQQATQLQYTVGQNYVYDVSGIVQNNGYVVTTQSSTDGYYSYMQSTLVLQPTAENATCYTFVMNLFDTVVSVNNTDPKVQSQSAVFDNSLGYDVYFIQTKTGQILEIIYDADDSEYYLNVKISVINGFQTSIVSVGQTDVVAESDPLGVHSSKISGSAGSYTNSLLLTKTFNQADFTAFADPNLATSNVALGAQANVALHPSGYVMSGVVSQSVIFTDATPSSSSATLNKKSVVGASLDNTTGFEMDLASTGTLTLSYNAQSAYASKTFVNKPVNSVSTDMFGFGSNAVQLSATRAATLLNFAQALESAIAGDASIALLNKVGKHVVYNQGDAELLLPYMSEVILGDLTMRDRIFYIISVAQHEDLLIKFGLFNQDCSVRMRAVLAAVYFKAPSAQLLMALQQVADEETCGSDVAHVANNIIEKSLIGSQQKIFASLFPYNVSVTKEVKLGGHIAGVTLQTNLFAGSNFDCKQPTFNYEAFGEVEATATLFGYDQQALDAQIVYGQVGASPLANQLTLSVWGNVVYQKPIPTQQVDCNLHSYPLAHTAPGFDLQYTVWVSIIPVTFAAKASLTLNLDWGWDVCLTDLSASVQADGDSAITISGSSTTDLLLLRAGFDISASFSIDVTPKASVQGTLCQIDFEVDVNEDPMDASVTSYYQWRECKFLFFDCHWGNHNQQTWWDWDAPAKSFTLFQQTYKIAH